MQLVYSTAPTDWNFFLELLPGTSSWNFFLAVDILLFNLYFVSVIYLLTWFFIDDIIKNNVRMLTEIIIFQ